MSFTRSSPDGRELGVEAYLRELRVGRCLLVHYGDEPGVYMERVLLWPASGPNSRGVWAVRTPDDDIYPEDVTGGSPDDGPDKVVLLNKHCSGPRSLRGRMYRFSTYWDWDELKAFVEMGRACLRADGYALASPPDEVWFEGVPRTIGAVLGLALPRVSLPVREPLGGATTPPRPPGLGPPRAEAPRPMDLSPRGEGSPADELAPGEGHVWVLMEAKFGMLKGEQVHLSEGDIRMGDRALHCLDDGDVVASKRVPIHQAAAELEESGADARVMVPLVYDTEGKRFREFGDAVRHMRQEAVVEFPITGDRSTGWLLRYITEHGGTPDGRHTKWAAEQKVEKDSAAYHIHDLLGLALELGATFDQLDLTNLASMEVVSRLYQLTEETNGSMRVEGFEHYVGRDVAGSLKRGIALAPGLAKYTTDRLAQQTSLLKERRKAREEMASAKAKPQK